jgi:hypothetical protein
MGIIQSFERRLQGAVGNTFARLFGGSVHPAEVITALQEEATARLTHEGGRVIAPNHFRVRLGPTDRRGIGDDDARVAAALSDTIREYLDDQGWYVFGDIEVDLEESPSLHTGQFRVSSAVDPDAGSDVSFTGEPVDEPYPPDREPGYTDGNDRRRGSAAEPETVALLRTDDGSGRSYRLQPGSNIVGRGQDASFRLPDTSVSRRHFDVYFDGRIAVVHDLGSTNGTAVNGATVQTWQLADGDVIHVGHSTITFDQRG